MTIDRADPPAPAHPPADIVSALGRVPPGTFTSSVAYYDEVGSTNDLVDRAARDGAPEGTVIVAGAQRSGRGRLGRAWFSPPGAGLYVSVLIRPAGSAWITAAGASAPGFSTLTLLAGVALAEALREVTGLPIEIKWPNDLVMSRRKLCGILAEASAGVGGIRHVVLGFGVNLRTAAYPPELAGRATSLEDELGRPVDRGIVLAAMLAGLGARYAEARAGQAGAVLQRWRELAPSSVGSRVRWTGASGPIEGVTRGIDDEGALLVEVDERIERVIAGEVSWP